MSDAHDCEAYAVTVTQRGVTDTRCSVCGCACKPADLSADQRIVENIDVQQAAVVERLESAKELECTTAVRDDELIRLWTSWDEDEASHSGVSAAEVASAYARRDARVASVPEPECLRKWRGLSSSLQAEALAAVNGYAGGDHQRDETRPGGEFEHYYWAALCLEQLSSPTPAVVRKWAPSPELMQKTVAELDELIASDYAVTHKGARMLHILVVDHGISTSKALKARLAPVTAVVAAAEPNFGGDDLPALDDADAGMAFVGTEPNGDVELRVAAQGRQASVYLSREFWLEVARKAWSEQPAVVAVASAGDVEHLQKMNKDCRDMVAEYAAGPKRVFTESPIHYRFPEAPGPQIAALGRATIIDRENIETLLDALDGMQSWDADTSIGAAMLKLRAMLEAER